MLMGNARQFYFDSLKKKNLSIEELEMADKSRFKTPERVHALLREWESLSLKSVTTSSLKNSLSACLKNLIERLSDIQSSLPAKYHSEKILLYKILNAVRDVESCKLAYHKPADIVQGVTSDLHADLATARHSEKVENKPIAHLVDRRYFQKSGKQTPVTNGAKKCFVWARVGC